MMLTVLLTASENYPLLYERQGTPLFESSEKFKKLQNYDSMKSDISDYLQNVNKVKSIGFDADMSQEKDLIKSYLKSLRELQKKHDNIVRASAYKLLNSIKENNYKEFILLSDLGLDYYASKDKLKQEILSFYKKNRSKKRIPTLDNLMKKDRLSIKHESTSSNYNFIPNSSNSRSKKIILLSLKGCSWCTKVKSLLDESGKAYRELNAKKGYGASLYKKHNGSGVPITIVGDEVIRGYSKDRILQAIR